LYFLADNPRESYPQKFALATITDEIKFVLIQQQKIRFLALTKHN